MSHPKIGESCAEYEERMSRRAPERSAKDYAIEHAEYLAQAVEAYMTARAALDAAVVAYAETDGDDEQQRMDEADAVASEHFNGLRGAIYEFRKRAERAKAPSPSSDTGASR